MTVQSRCVHLPQQQQQCVELRQTARHQPKSFPVFSALLSQVMCEHLLKCLKLSQRHPEIFSELVVLQLFSEEVKIFLSIPAILEIMMMMRRSSSLEDETIFSPERPAKTLSFFFWGGLQIHVTAGVLIHQHFCMCNISHFQVIYSWCIQRAKTSGMSIVIRSRKMWKGNLGGEAVAVTVVTIFNCTPLKSDWSELEKTTLQLQKVFWRNKLPRTLFFTASISANTNKRAASADLTQILRMRAAFRLDFSLFIYLFPPPVGSAGPSLQTWIFGWV